MTEDITLEEHAKRTWCDDLLAGLTPAELALASEIMNGRDTVLPMTSTERTLLGRIREKALSMNPPPNVRL